MTQAARWIHLASLGTSELRIVCQGFARAQSGHGMPLALWGRPTESLCLHDRLWADPGEFVFALLVPRRFAPGRSERWLGWGLSPVVAAFRRCGAPAYLDGSAVCMHARRIGGGAAFELDGHAAVVGYFLPEPPASTERGRLLGFDPWLAALDREGRARKTLAAFRTGLEAQHGWRFDTAWPNAAELAAISDARIESGIITLETAR